MIIRGVIVRVYVSSLVRLVLIYLMVVISFCMVFDIVLVCWVSCCNLFWFLEFIVSVLVMLK